jgi:hypothetical protein
MGLAGPKYILGSWPEGYKMFVHYKGPQDNPRTDKYLIGMSLSTTALSLHLMAAFDLRLDTRQAFSLDPGVCSARSVAHDGRKPTKVQLRLQVLYTHTPTKYQPSSRLNYPFRRFACCSYSPVNPSAFESPPASTTNPIPDGEGKMEGENI